VISVEMLPKVTSLREAVNEVIRNNQEQGYPPNRFKQMVSVSDQDLPNVCLRLVTSKDALNELYFVLMKHPRLLTLEDFISHFGDQWGFEEVVVKAAKDRSKIFDEAAKRQRFVNLPNK
jgi:hypothetical protein